MKLKVFKTLSLYFLVMLILLLCSRVVYGGLAPDFTLVDIDGNSFSLSDFRGKVVILDFFSTLCGPCMEEMAHLKVVKAEFGSKVVIISISTALGHDTDEILRQMRDNYGITWIVAMDTDLVRVKYDIPTIPMLYIIDQKGNIRHEHSDLTEASVLIQEIYEIMPESLVTDLNEDGKVNIQDLFIVAKAFQTKPGDEHWDPRADLDGNDLINIVDLYEVAKDYGKAA